MVGVLDGCFLGWLVPRLGGGCFCRYYYCSSYFCSLSHSYPSSVSFSSSPFFSSLFCFLICQVVYAMPGLRRLRLPDIILTSIFLFAILRLTIIRVTFVFFCCEPSVSLISLLCSHASLAFSSSVFSILCRSLLFCHYFSSCVSNFRFFFFSLLFSHYCLTSSIPLLLLLFVSQYSSVMILVLLRVTILPIMILPMFFSFGHVCFWCNVSLAVFIIIICLLCLFVSIMRRTLPLLISSTCHGSSSAIILLLFLSLFLLSGLFCFFWDSDSPSSSVRVLSSFVTPLHLFLLLSCLCCREHCGRPAPSVAPDPLHDGPREVRVAETGFVNAAHPLRGARRRATSPHSSAWTALPLSASGLEGCSGASVPATRGAF